MRKATLSILLIATLLASSFAVARPSYALSVPTNPVCFLAGLASLGACAAGGQVFQSIKDDLPQIVSNTFTFLLQVILSHLVGVGQVNFNHGDNINASPNTRIALPYGALGSMGAGIGHLYQPPVTIQEYLATIHPIGTAYAANAPVSQQDIFGGVIMGFWGAARNIAYGLFTIVIIVIGLMLMLRSRIDPRTTITVTAALPNLVIALILITFSLTLATLLINLGQLLEELVKNILTNAVITPTPLLNTNGTLINSVGLNITDMWVAFLNPFTSQGVSFGGGLGALNPVTLLLDVVLAIIAFILALEIFFMLAIRYIYILIKPIAAPFIFLVGAIPGRGSASTGWFRGYLADVLTFPAVLLLLNLAFAIRTALGPVWAGNNGAGSNGDPFGMFDPGVNVLPIITIGLLYIITKVPAFLENALQATENPYVARKGSDLGKLLKRVPVLGNIM